MSPPSAESRLDILHVLSAKLRLSGEAREELRHLAKTCVGYVGADFGAICREAALLALQGHQSQELDSRADVGPCSTPTVTRSHLQTALKSVRPASQRTMWSMEVPYTKWNDIGGKLSSVMRLCCVRMHWAHLLIHGRPIYKVAELTLLRFYRPCFCESSTSTLHRMALAVPRNVQNVGHSTVAVSRQPLLALYCTVSTELPGVAWHLQRHHASWPTWLQQDNACEGCCHRFRSDFHYGNTSTNHVVVCWGC